MHTRLSPDNPYGPGRYGFAWEHIPPGSTAHLDFGCYDGAFLRSLRPKAIGRLVGVDVNRDAIAAAAGAPDIEFRHIRPAATLPFPDASFSSITILDVIEHVYDQSALLDELNRVLQADGRLIVTAPGRHVFSFLDLGNLKFRFPRLHRWYYCRRHSLQEYHRRYVANPDGLIGDVSAEKRWHEHFSRRTMAALLERCGFAVVEFDGSGLFARPIEALELTIGRLPPIRRTLRQAMSLDARWFASTNLFCIARKAGC